MAFYANYVLWCMECGVCSAVCHGRRRYWSVDGGRTCSQCATCTAGFAVSSACTATANTVCVDVNECLASPCRCGPMDAAIHAQMRMPFASSMILVRLSTTHRSIPHPIASPLPIALTH